MLLYIQVFSENKLHDEDVQKSLKEVWCTMKCIYFDKIQIYKVNI